MYKYSLCEVFARKLLPSIKLYLAYRLVSEYKYPQLRVSNILGIKQPLINYVLSGRRKPRFINYILSNSDFKKILDDIAYEIASDGMDLNNKCITCYICSRLKNSSLLSNILEEIGLSKSEVYVPS